MSIIKYRSAHILPTFHKLSLKYIQLCVQLLKLLFHGPLLTTLKSAESSGEQQSKIDSGQMVVFRTEMLLALAPWGHLCCFRSGSSLKIAVTCSWRSSTTSRSLYQGRAPGTAGGLSITWAVRHQHSQPLLHRSEAPAGFQRITEWSTPSPNNF